MGLGFSLLGESEADRVQREQEVVASSRIEAAMQREQREAQSTVKLLLLGCGESGKSTIFKQIIGLYGKGFSSSDLVHYRDIIRENAAHLLRHIVRTAARAGLQHAAVDYFNSDAASDLTPATLEQWNAIDDEAHVNAITSAMLGSDAAAYLLSRLSQFVDPSYLPSRDDIVRVRVKTVGIVETAFAINEEPFVLVDVGGQRSERKKWIHCFEEVTCILFVAALSAYDQVLEEDGETNRLDEAMDLFAQICSDRWLAGKPIVLFLNKRDVFAEKLQRIPLSRYQTAYTGANTLGEAAAYIESRFLAQNRDPSRPIYPHITCATDPHNVDVVFQSVKESVLHEALGAVSME